MEDAKTKGAGFISLRNFVQSRFGEKAFEAWMNSLSDELQYAVRYALATSWYSVSKLYLPAVKSMCERFFQEAPSSGARELGTSAAQRELSGIYRIVLKAGSPNLMVSAASRTWPMLYKPGSLLSTVNKKGHAVIRTRDVPIQDSLWGDMVTGWLEKALMLAGGKSGKVTAVQKTDSEETYFEFTVYWE